MKSVEALNELTSRNCLRHVIFSLLWALKAAVDQTVCCFGLVHCLAEVSVLLNVKQQPQLQKAQGESEHVLSQGNNICWSLCCSAESPSVLGHHTANWVMQNYLITKRRSWSKLTAWFVLHTSEVSGRKKGLTFSFCVVPVLLSGSEWHINYFLFFLFPQQWTTVCWHFPLETLFIANILWAPSECGAMCCSHIT